MQASVYAVWACQASGSLFVTPRSQFSAQNPSRVLWSYDHAWGHKTTHYLLSHSLAPMKRLIPKTARPTKPKDIFLYHSTRGQQAPPPGKSICHSFPKVFRLRVPSYFQTSSSTAWALTGSYIAFICANQGRYQNCWKTHLQFPPRKKNLKSATRTRAQNLLMTISIRVIFIVVNIRWG